MRIRNLIVGVMLAGAGLSAAAAAPVKTFFDLVSDERVMLDVDIADEDLSVAGAPLRNVRVRVSLVRPVDLGGRDLTALRAALDAAAGVTFTDSGALSVDSWPSLRPAADSEAGVRCGQWLSVNTSLVCLDNDMAVWRADTEMYTGGAHGMYSAGFVNYSIADGRVIQFSDVFGPDAKPTLAKAIRAWIAQSVYARDVTAYSDCGLEAVEVPSAFYFDGQGKVWFVYQPYEIAPYSAGMIFVPLNLWEIGDTLTPYGRRLFGIGAE